MSDKLDLIGVPGEYADTLGVPSTCDPSLRKGKPFVRRVGKMLVAETGEVVSTYTHRHNQTRPF